MITLDSLPFVRKTEVQVTFELWCPDRTGTLEAQAQRGRDYANSLVSYMQEQDNQVLLLQIVKAIEPEILEFTVEKAFFTELGAILASQG